MSIMAQLQQNARDFPHRVFVIDRRHTLTYEETVQRTLAAAGHFRALGLRRAHFYAPDSASVIVGLLAADHIGASSCVLNYWHRKADLHNMLAQIGSGTLFSDRPSQHSANRAHDIAGILAERHEEHVSGNAARAIPDNGNDRTVDSGGVTILTSGTTGPPKAARYSWGRLLNQVRHIERSEPRMWLLTYDLSHFAGIQVLLHVLANGHTLVIPPSHHFDDIFATIKRYKVDSISGTPTFWRLFAGHLSRYNDKALPLKQITLGGEICNGELLSRLKQLFPQATITQIYATTELGSCFAVRDGRPGFPVEFLQRQVGNVRLKIVGGELYCKARNRMLGYVGQSTAEGECGWMPTGDLVEVQGDRVLFRGRKCEIINVGGVKIWPAKVEEIILQEESVLAARVYGRPNPVTGQLVAAELEVAPGAQHDNLIREIRAICDKQLNRYEQPRNFKIVERIDRRNGKIARSSS